MAKIPFIQHTAAGLHITHEKIRWVELSRIRDHIWVKKVDSEPVGNDLESALRKLIDRQVVTHPFVTVNVDSIPGVRKLVNMPVIDEEDILGEWIDKQYSQIVEKMGSSETFLIRHTIMDLNDENGKCLFAAIKKDDRDKIENILTGVGLTPTIITTGFLATAYGLLLTPEFVNGQHKILRLFEDESFIGHYKNGFLNSYSQLDANQMSTTDILDELNLMFETNSVLNVE